MLHLAKAEPPLLSNNPASGSGNQIHQLSAPSMVSDHDPTHCPFLRHRYCCDCDGELHPVLSSWGTVGSEISLTLKLSFPRHHQSFIYSRTLLLSTSPHLQHHTRERENFEVRNSGTIDEIDRENRNKIIHPSRLNRG